MPPIRSSPSARKTQAFAGGAQIGLQKQWDWIVVGAEVSYTWADLKGSKPSELVVGTSLTSEANNLLLVTARLGFAWQHVLAYVKGGYASVDVAFSSLGASASKRADGSVAGLGLEFGLTPHITIGAEYDWLKVNAAAPGALDAGVDIQTLTARLNFKFGPRAGPLPTNRRAVQGDCLGVQEAIVLSCISFVHRCACRVAHVSDPMRNPVLIELTRGALVESVHAGAIAVVRADGEVVAGVGDIARPIFPRSAIKPLQALPFLESGAVDRFGFGAPQIALACGSHVGAATHVAGVTALLGGAGLSAAALACGAHEPMDAATARQMLRSSASPSPLHHNCSGKHAAMLATAVHLGEPTDGYWRPDHPVQRRIRRALEDMTGCALGPDALGIDGCSVPNWAIPLAGLARAFARLATGAGLAPERAEVCRRVRDSCWAHPDLVAGRGHLVTLIMQRLPGQVLVKSWRRGCLLRRLRRSGPRLCTEDRRRRQARLGSGRGAADLAAPPRRAAPWARSAPHQLARPASRRDARRRRAGRHAAAPALNGYFASQAGCRPHPPGDTPVPVFSFGRAPRGWQP